MNNISYLKMKRLLIAFTLVIVSLAASCQSQFHKGVETDDIQDLTPGVGVTIELLKINSANFSLATQPTNFINFPGNNTIQTYIGGTAITTIASTGLFMLNNTGITFNGGRLSFNDSNTQIWEDASGNLTLKDANAGTTILSELAGEKEVSYATCPDNATTNISLDTDGVSFRLHYVAERNMGSGPRKQSGTIDLLYDDVTDISYYSSDYVGVDLDFAITSSDVAGAVRLDIVVGNANSNDLSFAYNVISKLYE